MSWFGKKQKEVNKSSGSGLPELPPMPNDFDNMPRFKGFEKAPEKKFSEIYISKPPAPPKYSLNAPMEPRYVPSEPPVIRPDLPPLPAFPNSQAGDSLSREAVKNAMRDDEQEEEGNKILTQEISDSYENYIEPQAPPAPMKEIREYARPKEAREQIFVRIDKYQDSLSEFNEIKRKIKEIEDLLADIKEIREKESFELQEWEREIREAKNKLDKIDNSLFKQLED